MDYSLHPYFRYQNYTDDIWPYININCFDTPALIRHKFKQILSTLLIQDNDTKLYWE